MNQRYQELAQQATIRVNNPIVNTDGQVVCDDWEEGISISKFAELIVWECIDLSLGSSHRDDDMGAIIADKIKRHFGVEE
jgi:hypothetical protein